MLNEERQPKKKKRKNPIQTNKTILLGGQILYKYTRVFSCSVHKQQQINKINDTIDLLQTNEIHRKTKQDKYKENCKFLEVS